ncbi:hypothetical protein [Mesobacillus zeae]|uniref:Uncharacterized protein n=1 Tax=Mesobacillus zeae TaxID=1917180 RepID=A0A398BCX6_9BACI|nr:hypothetical protein [Mesobacillus zeae]RID85640.1 hypothetical protein D1970_08780 [Mesobacillus zeae]
MLTRKLYKLYRRQGYNDKQIMILADCTRRDIRHVREAFEKEIPKHLLDKAKALGLSSDAVKWRISVKKWSAEEACTIPKQEKAFTMEELNNAKVHPATVYKRIARGWSRDQALNTPGRREKKRCPCCGK